MKAGFRVPMFLLVLSGLSCSNEIWAQTFMTLHVFTGGIDGASPLDRLLLSDDTLYGTTHYHISTNASWVQGTVFAVKVDRTGFTTLHTFDDSYSDGYGPEAGLVLSSNILYGTTRYGGIGSTEGTVFAVNTNGVAYRILHSFWTVSYPLNDEGLGPDAELVLSGTTLYGTASIGGSSGAGTVFAVNVDGTGFTNLHNFNRNEGSGPSALILSGSRLYGTTFTAGPSGNGAVFAVNTDGADFTNLHSFTALSGVTNSDGANPYAGLVLSGNTLYGTTSRGGSSGAGTVFAVSTDGTSFANLHSFTALSGTSRTNSDGYDIRSGLVLSGNTLYGTASRGGSSGNGTVFAVNTNGTGFTCLYNFSALAHGTNTDGANPNASLTKSANILYGTTPYGGSLCHGTVFSISFPPKLNIHLVGEDVLLTWPTNYAGFDYRGYHLESSTNLASPNWTAVYPAPTVVNGQNIVTNSTSATQQFYRLSR